jgi:hypothetical protein
VLPALSGRPVQVVIRRSLGAHIGATSIPHRKIYLDASVLGHRGEFERILVHELFHFSWVRLSNAKRRAWEDVLAGEIAKGVHGELGWSAEWRKNALRRKDRLLRTPRWRRYACESFCDTAAWLYSGLRAHDEFTLSRRARAARRQWFAITLPRGAEVAV